MSKLAAVFDNITIKVKWLLHPFQGNLTCTLNAGDGHIIDNYSPEEWVLSFCMLQQHIIDVNNILYVNHSEKEMHFSILLRRFLSSLK